MAVCLSHKHYNDMIYRTLVAIDSINAIDALNRYIHSIVDPKKLCLDVLAVRVGYSQKGKWKERS